MDYIKICDITTAKEAESVNVIATVESRTPLEPWSNDKSSGTKVTGILCDETGAIDFVCFTKSSQKFDEILKVKQTYSFRHASVNKARKQYSKSNHDCQLNLEVTTTAGLLDRSPFERQVKVIAIKDLESVPDYGRVDIAGKVLDIPNPEKFYNTEIVKCVIQDRTGKVQLSFIGDDIKKNDFGINDVLLLENIQHRQWGQLRGLVSKTGTRKVNPVNNTITSFLPTDTSDCINMSPGKPKPTNVSVQNMVGGEGPLSVTAKVIATNINKDAVYNKCPFVACKSRVILLDNQLFRCNKCCKDYLVASSGIRLTIDIEGNREKRSIVLFNDKAENFLKTTVNELKNFTKDEQIQLEQCIIDKEFSFVVTPGRTEGEFICDSFSGSLTKQSLSPVNKPTASANGKSAIAIDLSGECLDLRSNTPWKLYPDNSVQNPHNNNQPMDLSIVSPSKKVKFGIADLLS